MAKLGGSGGSGREIKIFKDAAETISALKLVRAINDTEVRVAGSGVDFDTAQVLGIALNGASVGEKVQILILGQLGDAFFSSFTVNSPLFLSASGSITETAPGSGDFRSQVGKALGGSAIFLQIEQPISLV